MFIKEYFRKQKFSFYDKLMILLCSAKAFIAEINSKLSIEIKYLGLVKRFNGVDINQTSEHIKIHCSTYINKILSEHNWLDATLPCHTFPIPMKAENNYSRSLELAQAPSTAKA